MVAAVAEALVNHGPELSGVKAHRVALGAREGCRGRGVN
jgi:hypothetical protein